MDKRVVPCSENLPSNCIIWNGPDIPCLNICAGMAVSDAVYNIATSVCNLTTNSTINVSTLDLTAALALCNKVEPANRTLLTVLQLLADNNGCITTLINGINAQLAGLTAPPALSLNLKCLAQTDALGNAIPYTQNTVLQSLIDNICNMQVSLSYLQGKVIDLQTQISNIVITPSVTEVSTTTCLDAVSKPVSTQLKTVATTLCNYKTIVGQNNDVSIAISRMCNNANTKFGTATGWITNPVNLAQSYNNALIMLCNLIGRMETIETGCCKADCSTLSLTFGVEKSTSTSAIILFTSGYGTKIPAGFTDNGSYVIISDPLDIKNTLTVFTPITQNYQTTAINLSQFAAGRTLTFTLKSNMVNGTLTCQGLNTTSYVYNPTAIVAPPTTTNLTIAATGIGNSSTMMFQVTLDTPLAADVKINRVTADGYSDVACATNVTSATYNNFGVYPNPSLVTIPSGNSNSAVFPQTKTGFWSTGIAPAPIRYTVYNVIINGTNITQTGQVINIGGTNVSVIFGSCSS